MINYLVDEFKEQGVTLNKTHCDEVAKKEAGEKAKIELSLHSK